MVTQERVGVRALAGLAAAYGAQGERERAKELLSQALQSLEKSRKPQSAGAGASLPDLYHAVAVAHVRTQNTKGALDALEWAVRTGWHDASWLGQDSELRPLHQEPRFLDLLQQLRRFPKIEFPIPSSH